MGRKVLICSGGTGGHLFPAQSLARQLQKEDSIEILFAGGNLSTNKYFDSSTFRYLDISCAPLSFKQGFSIMSNGLKILKGVVESLRLIRKYQPDLIIAFGSYHTFPTLLAACLSKKKFFLHEQNKQMGIVNRLFAKKAKKIMVSFPDTEPFYSHSDYVKMPLKFERDIHLDKKQVLQSLHLSHSLKTILICGGSQGSLSINQTFIEAIQYLKEFQFQVIHLVGFKESIQSVKDFYQKEKILAYVKEFDPNIHKYMQACDFMISRLGASAISELFELKLPSILIPYPYAKGHQEHNADFMQNIVKGGVKLLEETLSAPLLAERIIQFFNDENIEKYRHHMHQYQEYHLVKDFSEIVKMELNLNEKK